MTNKQAKAEIMQIYGVLSPAKQQALDVAIKALEQQPCDDAISRQAVLDGIAKLKKSPWATDKRGNGFEYLITEALDVVADLCVKQLPPVTPQQKYGKWIYDDEYSDWFDVTYKCSCCKRSIIIPYVARNKVYKDYPYCHCGARMFEPQESEEKE